MENNSYAVAPNVASGDKLKVTSVLERLTIRLLWAQRDELQVGAWSHTLLANDFWRLYQNDADGGWLDSPDGSVMLKMGDVYLIPPGLRLSSRNDRPISQFFVHFDLSGVPPIVFREMIPGPTRLPQAPFLRERVTALSGRVEREKFSDFGVQCLLMGMLYEAFGLYFSDLPEYLRDLGQRRVFAMRPLLPALTYMHDHLDQRLTNRALAGLCSMSEDYFIRRFREAVGLPPSRYITECRVALAAQRLLFTGESIEEIAEQTGFRDRFYFSRVFTRQTGKPPAAYRQSPRT